MSPLITTSDYDGVLIGLHDLELFFTYFEGAAGVTFDREVYRRTHSWTAASGMDQHRLSDWYISFHEDNPHVDLACLPTNGAQQAITQISRLGAIHVATARHRRFETRLINKLAHHFGAQHFSSYSCGFVTSKVPVVQRLRANVFIDDSILLVRQVAVETDARAIMFPNVHNWYVLKERDPHVIYPRAANLIEPDMSVLDQAHTDQLTWAEIVDICHQLAEDVNKAKTTIVAL